MKNYLDLLTCDLMEMAMTYVADLYERDIRKVENKLDKVKSKIGGLEINYFAYLDYYNILYKNCFYSINNYLYSKFRYSHVILIKDYNMYYDNNANTSGKDYVSRPLNNPILLDILICCNDAITFTGNYYHNFLEGFEYIDDNELRDKYNIMYKNPKYIYFRLDMKA